MINDEKVMNLLKRLRSTGFKKATCLSLVVLLMTNGSSALSKEIQPDIEPKNDKPRIESREVVRKANIAIEVPKVPTEEEKIATILERENITREQLDVIIATVMGEAAPGSYLDAYAVINTFYNRKLSNKWINEVYRVTEEDVGNNIYEQITLINQSEVYTSGRYKEFLGLSEGYAYEATIDFLYTLDSMHDYLCFFASYGDKEGREQFVEGGNLYYSLLEEEDRVESVTRLTLER